MSVRLHAIGIAHCVVPLHRNNSLPTLTRTSSDFGCIIGFQKTKRKAGTLVTRLVNNRITQMLNFHMPRLIFLGLSRTFKHSRNSRRVRSLLRKDHKLGVKLRFLSKTLPFSPIIARISRGLTSRIM